MARCTKPRKEEKREEKKKTNTKQLSKLMLKTKELLHELIAKYDELLILYNSNPTSANKRKLEEYAYHLKNTSRLSELLLDYAKKNKITDVSAGDRQVRQLIKDSLELGEFVMVDGLIRNSSIVPRENISATGNIITIVIPSFHIERLVKKLDNALVNESTCIHIPCNNMIIIIETGEFTNVTNDNLYHIVKKTVLEYICDYSSLKETSLSNSITIAIN